METRTSLHQCLHVEQIKNLPFSRLIPNKYHMREFISILEQSNESLSRIEVIFTQPTQIMLESYKSPASELSTQFGVVYSDTDNDQIYMELIVTDTTDQKPVIKVDYVLGRAQLVVSNVISFRDHKPMNTSMGVQPGATDMGHTAMRWLLKQILKDAQARGFSQTRISSHTRYTGSRAVHGTQTDVSQAPVNYSVNQKITEHRIYLGPWTILD
jgi:hypothetical protein